MATKNIEMATKN